MTPSLFQRAIQHGERHFSIKTLADNLLDKRRRPKHKLGTVMRCVIAMFLSRAGSVHALDETADSSLWRKWLKTALPREDTVRRVMNMVSPEQLRQIIHTVYTIAKRKKMLPPTAGNWQAIIFDATETSSSELRCCDGCCVRHIKVKKKPKLNDIASVLKEATNAGLPVADEQADTETIVQYYHREVLAVLPYADGEFLLDFEPILSGEDEVTAALRLFARVLESYPRAFNLAASDALYTNATWFNEIKKSGIEVISVFKQENRDLMRDFRAVCTLQTPMEHQQDGRHYQLWDSGGFSTWPQMAYPVRVVRSIERWTVTRQGLGEQKKLKPKQRRQNFESEWIWTTTLPVALAKTMAVVLLGHQRWLIEGGFNELKNWWHIKHVYAHQQVAILNFFLVAILVCNLFHLFMQRNLNKAWRKKSMKHIMARVKACFINAVWYAAGDIHPKHRPLAVAT